MKRFGILAACLLGALGLAGCGDGGIQSPDFTPVLQTLALDSDAPADSSAGAPANQRSLPAGRAASLDVLGQFSQPPGSVGFPDPGPEQTLSGVSFTLSPDNVAAITDGQLVGSSVGGVVTVTANRDGVSSNPVMFRIDSPVLTDITIAPSSATISVNETATFSATGTFTDSSMMPIVVNWSVQPSGVVTLNPTSSQTTTATPLIGTQGQTATITASAVSGDGTTISSTATININNELITGLTGLRPSFPTVAPGMTIEFTAIGTFSSDSGATSRTGDLPDSVVDWSSSDPAFAPIDADGVATGQAPGGQFTDITAALNAVRVPVSQTTPNPRSATTRLFITDARCITPLLQLSTTNAATTSSSASTGCVGCAVSNGDAVIDGDVDTFGTISVPLGLGGATNSLIVDGTAAQPSGSIVGFVVGRPAGTLGTELLTSLSIGTRLAQAPAENAGASTPPVVNLLGQLGGQDVALISFTTSQPYDGLILTFNSGVSAVAASVNVFQACTAAQNVPFP